MPHNAKQTIRPFSLVSRTNYNSQKSINAGDESSPNMYINDQFDYPKKSSVKNRKDLSKQIQNIKRTNFHSLNQSQVHFIDDFESKNNR